MGDMGDMGDTDAGLLTISDAATVAGVSLRTMRRWVSCGQVVTVGRGRHRRVPAASLSKLGDKRAISDNGPVTDERANGDNPANGDIRAMGDSGHGTDGRHVGDNGAIGDIEADRLAELVALVDRYKAEAQANAVAAAIWQERARVLGEQLALAAPPQSTLDASTAPQPSTLTPEAPAVDWLPRALFSAGALVLLLATVLLLAAWRW